MSREVGIRFELGAALDGSFGSAFGAATGHLRGISQSIRDMERQPVGKLGEKLQQQREKLRGLGTSLREAQGQLATLKARSEAMGGATGILARQIQQAEIRVNGLHGQMEGTSQSYRNSVAAATTAAGSVRGLSAAYQELKGKIADQRREQEKATASLEVTKAADAKRNALRGTVMAAPTANAAKLAVGDDLVRQKEHLRGLGTSLREAQGQLATLKERAAASGGATGLLARQTQQAEAQVVALNRELRTGSAAYRETAAVAASLGGSIRGLSQDYRHMQTEAGKAAAAQARLGENRARMDTLRGKRDELNSRLLTTTAQAATVAVPVKLAIDFESSMADVKKVTDFDDTGFKVFSQDLLNLTTRLPMTAKGIAEIAAAAGSAGIQKSELLTFAEDAAKMGIAFDMSAEKAGAAMTGLRNNFKLSQDGVRLLGDSINFLSNSMDAKAGQIVDFANRAGGTAKIYGFTGQGVAALGAAFLDAKVGAEEASTATNAMLIRLGTADKLSEDAQKEFEALGLSGEGMAKAFKEDAEGALMYFLQTVAKSKDPMRALNAIMGAEHAPKIARMVNNLDHYKEALDKVSSAENYQGATNKEYATRADTTANNIQLLQNSASRLGIELGNTLLPVTNAVAGGLSGLANFAADLAQRFPNVTAALMTGGAAMATLAVGGLGLGLAINGVQTSTQSLKMATDAMRNAQLLSTAGTKAATMATWALNAASRAGAIGARLLAGGLRSALLATGVGAILVGVGLAADYLISNWETVGPVLSQAFSSVTSAITGAYDSVVNFCLTASANAVDIWNRTGVFFSALGANFISLFSPVTTYITSLWERGSTAVQSAWSVTADFFSGVWNFITGAAGSAADGVVGVWNQAATWFSGIWSGVSGACIMAFEIIGGVFGTVWQHITSVFSPLGEFFTSVWGGAISVFGWAREQMALVFDWLAEKLSWLTESLNFVSGVAGKVGSAVSGAWSAAFGDYSWDKNAPEVKPSVTPVADAAKDKPLATTSGNAKMPVTSPNAEQTKNAHFDALMKEGMGTSGKKKGSGSGKKSSASSGTTIVSVGGDNRSLETVFIPADQSPSGAQTRAWQKPAATATGKVATATSALMSATPQTPALATVSARPGITPLSQTQPQNTTPLLTFDTALQKATAALQTFGGKVAKLFETSGTSGLSNISAHMSGMSLTPTTDNMTDLLSNRALPRLPFLLEEIDAKNLATQQDTSPVSASASGLTLNQSFNLGGEEDLKQMLQKAAPEMRDMVMRILAEWQSNRRRTQYAQ